jgi:hypothetical protein
MVAEEDELFDEDAGAMLLEGLGDFMVSRRGLSLIRPCSMHISMSAACSLYVSMSVARKKGVLCTLA